MAAAMVFCVSCGHKLAGRYCGQCGGDSQSTADAQSEVPVLAVPAGGAKNLLTQNASKRKGSADASAPKRKGSSAASKRKGSAAGGIGVAQASGQVLENLPAAVASRASPPFTQTAAHGGKKFGKVHAGPGRPPAKTYEATDADMRGFLPPNMTAWLQPLDLVVCGLIKTLQRARRGRHLARHLQAWKQKQDEIMGAALHAKQTPPPLEPWRPPNPTLMEGIFFYQQTHEEELQQKKTQADIPIRL